MKWLKVFTKDIRLVDRLSGTGPYYLDQYNFRVLKVSNTDGEEIYDIFYDHGRGTKIHKDRIKFYMNGGSNSGSTKIKSLTIGKTFMANTGVKRLIEIMTTVDYELRRKPGINLKIQKTFYVIEDDLNDKLENLGL